MQQQISRADYLITLVGTSAMPNLIGIVLRIKQDGKVYFIHTKETEKISSNLMSFLEKSNENSKESLNIESQLVEIENYDNPKEVYNEMLIKFQNIKEDISKSSKKDVTIEINYTGGTKVMSSIACSIFKEVFREEKNVNFTYLDGEKSKAFIHNNQNNKQGKSVTGIEYSSKNSIIPLNIMDVIYVHKAIDDDYKYKDGNEEFVQSKFSKDMFQYICQHEDKRIEIIEYLEILNNRLSQKQYITKDKVIEFLEGFPKKNTLLKDYKGYKDFLNAFNIDENKLSSNVLKASVIRGLKGDWFEDVIHGVLNQLKDEDIVDDFVCNLSRQREDKCEKENKREMEIDFIAMKDYKLYFISVSTVENVEHSKFKLYEIKQRAKILSESECAVATITFVENKDEIVEGYREIWQETPKNTLVISWSELSKTKDIIREWINKRGGNL